VTVTVTGAAMMKIDTAKVIAATAVSIFISATVKAEASVSIVSAMNDFATEYCVGSGWPMLAMQ